MALAGALTAFEWPEDRVTNASFSAPFGHLRGDTIAGSLIFARPGPVHTSDSGTVLAIVREPESGSDRFYSTLGNMVIVDHQDELLTVYANLETIDLPPGVTEIVTTTALGRSGASAWEASPAGLEFQVIDVLHSRMINPRILMPRLEDEPPQRIPSISAESKTREVIRIGAATRFPAGVYQLYRDYEPLRIPYSTTVSVNGADIETITYNMLTQRDGRLTIMGKHYYGQDAVYPENPPGTRRALLGEVPLLRGRNTIRILVSNENGLEETSSVYVVENF
jgi:murein DD-endopeptidase MepM/ murein hydrolase activator NlpD